MKFYIAARTAKAKEVEEIYALIKSKGHDISYDWLHTTYVLRPYKEHESEIAAFLEDEMRAILESDVFVILSDENGTGMYIEMGLALGRAMETDTIKLYSIGDANETTVFHLHPKVKRLHDFTEVLRDLGI